LELGYLGALYAACWSAHKPTNDRVVSVPIGKVGAAQVIGAAMGPSKLTAIRAALIGPLISGLIQP
jgi:DNA-binding transcriptional regulator LsrR (DeoR family)